MEYSVPHTDGTTSTSLSWNTQSNLTTYFPWYGNDASTSSRFCFSNEIFYFEFGTSKVTYIQIYTKLRHLAHIGEVTNHKNKFEQLQARLLLGPFVQVILLLRTTDCVGFIVCNVINHWMLIYTSSAIGIQIIVRLYALTNTTKSPNWWKGLGN